MTQAGMQGILSLTLLSLRDDRTRVRSAATGRCVPTHVPSLPGAAMPTCLAVLLRHGGGLPHFGGPRSGILLNASEALPSAAAYGLGAVRSVARPRS